MSDALSVLDEKLRKLTRCLLDELLDEDTYRATKEELMLEKTKLVHEKNRLQRKRCNYWIEPTREIINTLETLGKTDSAKDLPELSKLVQKIGTNPTISSKKVSFSFSEDYDFVPSLLASVRVGHLEDASSRS